MSGRSFSVIRSSAAPLVSRVSLQFRSGNAVRLGSLKSLKIKDETIIPRDVGRTSGLQRHHHISASYFTGFPSTSRRGGRNDCGDEPEGEKNSDDGRWKWKLASCAGLVLAVLIKSDKLNVLSDWFTVHAARPIENDTYSYQGRRHSIGGERPDTNERNNYGNQRLLSKRQQFNFIADVVEKASTAVVCIQVKDHSMIDWYHGTPQTSSNGSGFIVSEDGLIVTNAHVVNCRGRESISVHLHDGRKYAGYMEAIDPEGDLALIRIKEKGLPTLKLGNSCETRIGEWVAAIGSPLSLSNSVTAGVVSNVKRGGQELGLRNRISYIQTDAAITFGNSGGPLVNLDGEAIGVNSMKVTAGISFAIPSDYVKRFLTEAEERRKKGTLRQTRRYLGLTLISLTEDLVADFEQRGTHCPVSHGAVVWKVVVGSPAYMAGIQPGDVIVKINDTEIVSVSDVYEAMEKADTLTVVVAREGRRYKCTVHPESLPFSG